MSARPSTPCKPPGRAFGPRPPHSWPMPCTSLTDGQALAQRPKQVRGFLRLLSKLVHVGLQRSAGLPLARPECGAQPHQAATTAAPDGSLWSCAAGMRTAGPGSPRFPRTCCRSSAHAQAAASSDSATRAVKLAARLDSRRSAAAVQSSSHVHLARPRGRSGMANRRLISTNACTQPSTDSILAFCSRLGARHGACTLQLAPSLSADRAPAHRSSCRFSGANSSCASGANSCRLHRSGSRGSMPSRRRRAASRCSRPGSPISWSNRMSARVRAGSERCCTTAVVAWSSARWAAASSAASPSDSLSHCRAVRSRAFQGATAPKLLSSLAPATHV